MPFRVATINLIVLMAAAMPVMGQEPAGTGQQAPVTGTQEQATVPGADQQGPVLTIDDAIALAVASNPTFATAVERVMRSRNQVEEARAAGRFRVDITPQYSRTGPPSTITFPGPGGQPQQIQTRPPSAIATNTTLSQPIDLFGRIRYARQIAGLNLNIQEFGQAQTLQQLVADVKTAYYNVLRAQANVDVAQSSIAAAEERLRVARAQFEAGVVARFDVTQAEVSVANLQQTLIQAQNGVAVAKGALNRLLGINVNEPFQVQEQAVTVEPVTVDIPAATQQALQARPEVQQAATGVTLAERNVKLTKTENKPAVALFVSTTSTNQISAFNENRITYEYGARLAWPIWNSGATKARVAEARNDVEIARQTLKTASLAVAFDVRTAALNLMEASRRVQTAQANVDLARESSRLANVRYQEGVSTQLEVINAESGLTQALTNLVSARYDFLTAQAQLQRATASQPEYQRFASAVPEVISGGVNR